MTYSSDQNSIDTSYSSKDYKSNYDTEIDIDKTYRNILCNIENEDDFLENDVICDAVVRRIEIIGEASSKLSQEFRKKYEV